MTWARNTKRTLADRKGGNALEYALIMGALAPIVIAGFGVYFGRLRDFIAAIAS